MELSIYLFIGQNTINTQGKSQRINKHHSSHNGEPEVCLYCTHRVDIFLTNLSQWSDSWLT